MDTMRNEELLESADDDKAKRFKNRISEFEAEIEKISGSSDLEEALHLEKRMETTVANVDEIITTLQERVSAVEGRIENIEKDLSSANGEDDGLADLEKRSVGGYHFSIRELKEPYKDLHENYDKQIQEWKTYQQEILDLKVDLLKKVLKDVHNDSIDKQAAEKVLDLAEKKYDESREIQETRLDQINSNVEDKVQTEVANTTVEQRERIARAEAKIGFMEEKLKESSEIFQAFLPILDKLMEQEDGDVVQVKDRVKDWQEQVEDPVEHAQENFGQQISDAVTREQEPVDDSEEMSSDQPKYRFSQRSLSEMKEEFEKVAENEDPENHTFTYIADNSDVSHNAIHKKIQKVRDEFEDDPIPNLGRKQKR